MKPIKIKFVKKGMVTATDVKDRMGRTLLTSGHKITEKNLKTLKSWGVTEVNVMLPDDKKKIPQKDDQLELKVPPALVEEMDSLFKHTDRRHPAIAELYDVCLNRKFKLLQEES
ncbi:MAG: hypothetical protein F3745_01850 [Nitrospinae bacterium]|nr:hypothetical protein [Nitrospinota bacterium]